jgi:hypothetical protein
LQSTFDLADEVSVGFCTTCRDSAHLLTFRTLVPACLKLVLLWFWVEPHRV